MNPQRMYLRIQAGGEGKTGGYDFVDVVHQSQSHTFLLQRYSSSMKNSGSCETLFL